jgi:hypothetical protein
MPLDCEEQPDDWEDAILAELERTREEILAEFGGDFNAYLDYLDTREAENRKRGLRYAVPPTCKAAASRPDVA